MYWRDKGPPLKKKIEWGAFIAFLRRPLLVTGVQMFPIVPWGAWRGSWGTDRAQGARAAPRTLPRCPWGGEEGARLQEIGHWKYTKALF